MPADSLPADLERLSNAIPALGEWAEFTGADNAYVARVGPLALVVRSFRDAGGEGGSWKAWLYEGDPSPVGGWVWYSGRNQTAGQLIDALREQGAKREIEHGRAAHTHARLSDAYADLLETA